jgi:agmatine/peptidylarginine deiminase
MPRSRGNVAELAPTIEMRPRLLTLAAVAVLAGGLHCTGSLAGAPVTVRGPADVASATAVRAGAHPSDAAVLDAAALHTPPTASARVPTPFVGDYWLAASERFEDTLRGDWDTTSALLVVYNSTWRLPLERLLAFAHDDLPVYVLATPEDTDSTEFRRWLAAMPFAGLVSIDLDTPWIRDYGPLEVQRARGISWLDMVYSPDERPLDDAVPTLLGEVFATPHETEQFSLDGGGIISNGDGLCGITEATLEGVQLDTADPDQVESFLETVGCRTLARLPELPSESTGHVDMVAQFLSRDKVAIAVPTDDSPTEVKEALDRARHALMQAAAVHGQALDFVDLPIVSHEERYYSYVNGLRTPSHYFVPSYSHVKPRLQAEAYRRLAQALEGVTLVPVDSDEMIESGGAVHCVTLGLKSDLSPRTQTALGSVRFTGKRSLLGSR